MKRIGFTSGSFDPVTDGHMDVIARASRMVDTLVIGIGKDGTMRYHIGLSFAKPITLEMPAVTDGTPAEASAPSDTPEPPPAIRNRW